MKNLATIFVEELSHFVNTPDLIKFIATLRNYSIVTLQDLQNISAEEFREYRGVGETKIEKLQSLKVLLNDNLECILYDDECASNDSSSFSKETIKELEEVPISYLISTLTEQKDRSALQSVSKYAKVDNVGELCILSRGTLTNTPSLGVTKVERVVLIQKSLQDEEYKNALISGYLDSLSVPCLPSVCGECLAQNVMQFIREYIALSKEQNERDLTATSIELIFLHGYSIENAATHCGIDQERIRQRVYYNTHPSFFKKMRQMAFGNLAEYDNPKFTLSEEFKKKLNELKINMRSGMLKTDFIQNVGINQVCDITQKKGVQTFLTKLLEVKKFSGETHGTRVKGDYLISGNINDLKKVWGVVFKTLDSFVKPFIKEELIGLVKKNYPNIQPWVIDTIVGTIESDENQFIVTKDGLAVKYQLQWNSLQSEQSRIERILYEAKRSMHRQEIERELIRLVDMYGLARPKSITPHSSNNIFELVEGGTWIWREYTDYRNTISKLELVRQYAAEHQKVLLSDVVEHVRKFISNAEEKSIRSLLLKCCNATTSDRYIYKTCQEQFPEEQVVTNSDLLPEVVKILEKGAKYSYQEICDLFTQKYGYSITKEKIRKICSNEDVFIVESPKSKRHGCLVMINPNWDGNYEKRTLERGIQAKWKKNVREEMINKLRYSPNYEMKRSELLSQIKSFVPKNVKFPNVYKILDDKIFIIKEKESGRGAIVTLNINEWETEFKKQLVNNTNNASTYSYEFEDHTLHEAQQKQLSNPRYNMRTNSDEDLNNLYASSKSLISYNLKLLLNDNMEITDFDSVWSYMVNQMDISRGGVDNAYYRMLNMLYGYMFGSTTRTDRYCLWVEIRLHFEPYLKKLLCSKGFSIMNVVKNKDGKEENREKALKELINLCQFNNILPPKDVNCHISQCISNILNKRNYKGHNAEDTPNDTIIVQNIQKTITLYLYTTMQFMNIS